MNSINMITNDFPEIKLFVSDMISSVNKISMKNSLSLILNFFASKIQ